MEELIITNQNIISLVAAGVLLFILPIVFVVVWKKMQKKNVSWKPLLIGAIGFLITVRVLELGVHMFAIVLENPVSEYINGHTWAYLLYGITMAGVFEECGRYIIIKFIMKKNKTKENMVMYGIGHGGIEVWAITLLQIINFLIIALVIQGQGMQMGLVTFGVNEEVMPAVETTLALVASFGPGMAFLFVFERLVCMFIHIFLTIVVYYGVRFEQKKYLLLAVLTHMVFDIMPCLYQRGIGTMVICEIWITICCMAVGIWARRLYKKAA